MEKLGTGRLSNLPKAGAQAVWIQGLSSETLYHLQIISFPSYKSQNLNL